MASFVEADVSHRPVLEFMTQKTGLAFTRSHTAWASQRIAESMARISVADPDVFLARLGSDGLALDDLIADLTVGESYFFRDPGIFEYLRTQFLPRMARERATDHVLRVWSAGCAAGQEAYSLAMLLEDAGWGHRSIVVGTDISRAALVKARRGTYGEWSFRGGDRSFMRRHFTSLGSTFTLAPRLRSHVKFQYHNLALDGIPSLAVGIFGLDLILCRNVLMYLDEHVIARVANQFRDVLATGGLLLTGAADPPLQRLAALSAEQFDEGTVYWRHGDAPARLSGQSVFHMSRNADPVSGTTRIAVEPDVVDTVPVSAAAGREVEDAASFARRVRGIMTRSGATVAAVEAARGMALFPLSIELAFLLALLPSVNGRYAEAAEAAKRALYLDRFQPAIHFFLATSLWNCGDLDGARRGFRNAHHLAAARPAEELVLFAEGETAGRLAAGAFAQLAMVDIESGARA